MSALNQFLCLGLSGLLVGSAQAQLVDFSNGQWHDLTQAFDEQTLYWPTSSTFTKTTVFAGHTEGGWYYTAYDIATAEHGGTHMDAPIHFYAGRDTADTVPLERLSGPGLVIDISAACANNADYLLTAADVLAWEQAHGEIEAGSIVLVRTGFASRWPDAEQYLGTAIRGPEAVPLLHFPGIGADAATLLVQRRVGAVGLDTASVDRGQSADFKTHRVLFEANIPGFENLADLSPLPARGAFVVAMPMKIRGGSGAPLRIAAFIPE